MLRMELRMEMVSINYNSNNNNNNSSNNAAQKMIHTTASSLMKMVTVLVSNLSKTRMRLIKSGKSSLLGDWIRNEEAINSTWNMIFY